MGYSSISKYFMDWNAVLLVLLGCSLVSVTIFFERIFFLRKSEIDASGFILGVKGAIEHQNIVQGITICENTGGAVAQIVRSALLRHNRSKEEIISSMEVTGLCEIARLEKNARVLSIIAHIAPLIGLLGTVLGFIQAFGEMRVSGMMDISTSRVGESMEYALITTAAGLVVAIPSIVAYNYLVSRVKTIVLEIQTVSAEVVDLLTHEI